MVQEPAPQLIAIPPVPNRLDEPVTDRSDPRIIERLGKVAVGIAEDTSLSETIREILSSIGELFGAAEIVFEIRVEEIRPALRWATYGIPTKRAAAIVDNLGAAYYPRDLLDKTLSDRFKVSKNAYYIPAEEWVKLVAQDPFGDHPSYYRHPENLQTPRKSPEEWHEADLYKFAVRDSSGELMATLEIDYSEQGKLFSKDALLGISLFVEMAAVALEKERAKRGGGRLPLKASQRTDLLEDILSIASSIVSEKDVMKLSETILTFVSSLFGFQKVSLVVYEESESMFRTMARFGYSSELPREAKRKLIPTEVVLEDLKEARRIGKSVYLTLAEDVGPSARVYFLDLPNGSSSTPSEPRKTDEFREGDYLAFALHDSTGRIVGVIYPSDPRDGRLPDKDAIETIEIFTSLAEVALENARLGHEREQALRVSSQRTEQLSRILDLVSGTMYVRNLDQMLDGLLKTLARLVGTKRMVIGVKYPELGAYRIEAVYGYSQKAVEAIKRIEYPISTVDTIIDLGPVRPPGATVKWRNKIGRMTYYLPAEGQQSLTPEELAYYPEPELIRLPRAGRGKWHELDWMDTIIADKDGVPIAYLETLKPRDDRVPDPDEIDIIEIFAGLAGIAIENSRMLQEHIDSRRNAELYTDVLSHDIKNFNQAILGYLDLLRLKVDKPEAQAYIVKIRDQVMNTSWLASNVRTMSRVTFGDVELSRLDMAIVLNECEKTLTQYYPGRKIVVRSAVGRNSYMIDADELVREIFINILTNAVKYDTHDTVEIDISVDSVVRGDRTFWTVSIADHGCGIPDDAKPIIFDRFSKAPKKKGSGMGLHIVKTLANRYHGRVWVEDRVKGDFTQGAVFKLELPAAE